MGCGWVVAQDGRFRLKVLERFMDESASFRVRRGRGRKGGWIVEFEVVE
jgi:hypothetical protein